MNYQKDFDYTYKGSHTRNGVKGHEIVLTPKHSNNRELIRIFISQDHRPLAMKMEQNGQTVSEINVTNYQTDLKLTKERFSFDRNLYPNAEIIDLR